MLSELQAIFKSTTKALEVLYVLKDLKPVARIMVNEDEYEAVNELLKKFNLTATLQGFKLEKTEQGAFSNKGLKLDLKDEKKGWYLVYVSKDKSKADLAKVAEFKDKHAQLGKILGYPECCCEFFQKYTEEQSKKSNDFVLPSLKESEGYKFPFWSNVGVRHLDVTLISHFPCNFKCEKSIEIAKKNFEVLKNNSDELGIMFPAILKGAVLYTENKGIFVFHKSNLEGNKLSFKAIFADANNDIYNELKDSEQVEIIDKNHVKLKNTELKGEDYGILVFE